MVIGAYRIVPVTRRFCGRFPLPPSGAKRHRGGESLRRLSFLCRVVSCLSAVLFIINTYKLICFVIIIYSFLPFVTPFVTPAVTFFLVVNFTLLQCYAFFLLIIAFSNYYYSLFFFIVIVYLITYLLLLLSLTVTL